MDRLLEKNREGTLKPSEKAQLTKLVAEAERLMVDNARRLEEFSRGEQGQPPRSSIPVTVWVTPHGRRWW
ncbi:MAG TPA: hypothetical protein VMP01_10735 [Pirellulaceae bacterium]|nr:hypothetical protein [Pirellulaceae bacterium]